MKGYRDDTVDVAQFSWPRDVAPSAQGFLVADSVNNAIRLISTTGVSTFAGGQLGSADGVGKAARFDTPQTIEVDAAGNAFVNDPSTCKLRKISPTAEVTTLDIQGICPGDVAFDKAGITYVTSKTPQVWRLTSSVPALLAGSVNPGYKDASGANAQFRQPAGIVCDSIGNLLISDAVDNRIRKIAPDGEVTTYAGSGLPAWSDGKGSFAAFNQPIGLAIDDQDNLYVTDSGNYMIRRITPDGTVTTLAGYGGIGALDGEGRFASFRSPTGLAVDSNGDLFVADNGNDKIRKISTAGTGVLVVRWAASQANPSVTNYQVTASAPAHPDKTCSTQETTCTLRGLASSVQYTITVTAQNASGMSSPTSVEATPN